MTCSCNPYGEFVLQLQANTAGLRQDLAAQHAGRPGPDHAQGRLAHRVAYSRSPNGEPLLQLYANTSWSTRPVCTPLHRAVLVGGKAQADMAKISAYVMQV